MYPFLDFHSEIFSFSTATSNLLIGFLFLLSFFVIAGVGQGFSQKLKSIFVWFTTVACVFIFGRLFHVFWERPEHFHAHPEEILELNGFTFYGSLLGGIFGFFLASRLLYSRFPTLRTELWDRAAILTATSYGVLRVGCFLNGCCWGKLSAVPWAVKYTNPESVMPVLGLPVHPVQLYDAAFGLCIAGLLISLKRQKNEFWQGRLMILFMTLYPVGRFVTEIFRGDSYRVTNILGMFSTSQAISLICFMVGLSVLTWFKFKQESLNEI